jgi:hypothetical protein
MCQCLTQSLLFQLQCQRNSSQDNFHLDKNIVHLIDDILWHMGFKTETQISKVILLIRFMTFISVISFKHFLTFISCITLITLILIKRSMVRCVKILELQITCGRTKGLLLPKQLMTWAISFVLQCEQAGLPTFEQPTRTTTPLLPARPWGRAPW